VTAPCKGTGRINEGRLEFSGRDQLSLAWLLAQKLFNVPIPGMGKVKHLEENIEAANLMLTAEDLNEIDRAFPSSRLMAVV
jgi:aryl-alcohol dehydrogenase-like predicted oxidoreductase